MVWAGWWANVFDVNNKNHNDFINKAKSLGVALNNEQANKLIDYVALLEKWNKVHNLTAVRDRQKMLSLHLLDSLAVASHIDADYLLDVGSGGGLPGIPLAIACPNKSVTLLDSSHKKTTFLRQAVIELGLKNVSVVTNRVEQCVVDKNFTGIVARAFADIPALIHKTQHLLATDGRWYLMKSVQLDEELSRTDHSVMVQHIHVIKVPDLDAVRYLVVMRRA